MRPLLVSEVLLPPSADVGWALDAGALALTEKALYLLGDDLAPVFEVELPERLPLAAVTVAPTCPASRWRPPVRSRYSPRRGTPCGAPDTACRRCLACRSHRSCLLDRSLMLWLFLPDEPNDHIIVLDARTGVEVARIDLPTDAGQAQFTAHPDGVHVALRVEVGIETSATFWLRLAGGRLLSRQARGSRFADLSPDGDFYLAMPTDGCRITIHDFDDSTVLAELAMEDLCAAADPDEIRTTEPAAIINDAVAIVPAWTDPGSRTETHVLVSTRNLRRLNRVNYGLEMPLGCLRPAATPGRWLTHDTSTGALRLWQLREPYTDEIDGQLTIW